MNTDASQEQDPFVEIGRRLREARELVNLSQYDVAEHLRLKVTTVRELEAGLNSLALAPTFIRGYIRSYAKLVQLPEAELMALLPANHANENGLDINRIKEYSQKKPRKKLDRWLTLFTWLILFVVIGLTGAWWWENHQAQQNTLVETASGVEQSHVEAPAVTPETASPSAESTPLVEDNEPFSPQNEPEHDTLTPTENDSQAEQAVSAPEPAEQPVSPSVSVPNNVEAASGELASQEQNNNDILMTFRADCWVEVIDSRGNNLYSGLQRRGGKLTLTGQPPYRVRLGAPNGVDIVYKGKQIDLSQYRNSSRIARLTLAAE